ncbi:MAG TPA: hypothetical protein VFU02_15450 [Polyangiaceae bacterium]|nr:hypothetical protein [Polyangiaceae bacterium]
MAAVFVVATPPEPDVEAEFDAPSPPGPVDVAPVVVFDIPPTEVVMPGPAPALTVVAAPS